MSKYSEQDLKNINLVTLSKIAGFEVEDYELSINKEEIHYGSRTISKDGFISTEDYFEQEEKN